METIITYVYHSCYSVETKDLFIVFDYYKGKLNIPEDKEVIFVSTHGHSDHYTSETLKLPGMENMTYILSSDIGELPSDENIVFIKNDKLTMDHLKTLYKSDNVHFVDKNMTYQIKLTSGKIIDVKTFGSTDLGISILMDVDGVNIFHGGDLNFWAWPSNDDSTMKKEYDDFMVEVKKIKKENIDICFFALDNRLEENYYKGADIFIREVRPKVFFPMHFGSNEQVSKRFKEDYKYDFTDVREIREENQIEMIYIWLMWYNILLYLRNKDILYSVNKWGNKMEKIAVLVDTAADIDIKMAEELGIYLLPLYVNLDNKYYKDRIDISPDEFYAWMEKNDTMPKTSTASPGDLTEIYEKIKSDGYNKLIAISLSSHFSSTNNLMQMFDVDGLETYVFDSKNLTMTEGFFAIYAKELIDQGLSFEEIIDKLNQKRNDSHVFFTLETFKYLVEGGRVPRTFGKIGDALSVKPIITVNPEEGTFKLMKVARGEKRVLRELKKIGESLVADVKDYYLFYGHGGYDQALAKIEDSLGDVIANAKKVYKVQISPTLGANTGPGLFGFGIFTLD